MFGKIYKEVSSVTKEEVLACCEYEDIPDYGDEMSYDEFVDDVNCGSLTDWDGCADLMLYKKVVKHTEVWLQRRAVYFHNGLILPFEALREIFGDDVGFVWYNK